MPLSDRFFAAVRNLVEWAAYDLQRTDAAVAQVVVLVDPATGEPYSSGGGLTDTQLRAAPVPVSLSSAIELEIKNDSGNPLPTIRYAQSFADHSIGALSSGQAAGTATIITANSARRCLILVPDVNCILTLTSGSAVGIPLLANVANIFSGEACPANQLYVHGMTTGHALTIYEA